MLAITRRIESKIPWIAKLTGNDQLSMDEVRRAKSCVSSRLSVEMFTTRFSQRFLEDAKDMLAMRSLDRRL